MLDTMTVGAQDLDEPRRWFPVRAFVLPCLVGLLVGVGAFLVTSLDAGQQPISFCVSATQQGFDPLSGAPHGASFNCPQLNGLGGQISVPQDVAMPPELAARHAIPVPLGFIVGAGLSLAGSAAVNARRRRSP